MSTTTRSAPSTRTAPGLRKESSPHGRKAPATQARARKSGAVESRSAVAGAGAGAGTGAGAPSPNRAGRGGTTSGIAESVLAGLFAGLANASENPIARLARGTGTTTEELMLATVCDDE